MKKKLVIIGGVAGGASAAARARRLSEDAEIVLFERGQYISFANCGLPYHIGGIIQDRARLLVQTPESMKNRFRLDVRVRTEVLSIDRENKTVLAKDLETGKEYTEKYDNLILSPGAEPVRPPIPGLKDPRVFTLRNMADMDSIIAHIQNSKPKKAVVVGAGYIGLEMTESLRHRGIEVTLVELAGQVMVTADPEMTAPLKQQLELNGVDLRLNCSITGVSGDDSGLSAHLSSGETVKCGIVLMNAGVRPESSLARDAGLDIGERGGIVVDEHMRTNDPFIYAVGDAVEVTDFVGGFKTMIPLAGPANRQGRIAADNIFGRTSIYNKTQGTAICKVFDQTAATTGLSEKTLKRIGIPYEKIYVHPASHATYYPGASPMSLKLIFDPSDGKILGAQAVGGDGVDKRIDVLAVAIRAGMKVYDLENLELTYAPPFGSAKDPVNYAGFVASNVMRGDVRLCHYEDVANPREDSFLLDVRSPFEVEAGTIPGARNIPVDNLRERLGELPKDKEILVFCQVGLRGYLACRILMQNGFKACNLTGGYKTYTAFRDAAPSPGRDIAKTPSEAPKEACSDTGETGAVCTPESLSGNALPNIVKNIDASGLQCPGPIMRLKQEMDDVASGNAVSISVTDPGFVHDIPAWCNSTGNELVNVRAEKGVYTAVIVKRDNKSQTAGIASMAKHKTIVVFSADLDKVMAAFIIANGAASMGSEVSLFFTFWGLNVLRKTNGPSVKKSAVESMFGFMMPKGATKLGLSRMNFAGLGKRMMVDIMNKKNVSAIPELIQAAKFSGIKLIACSMTMDVMGIRAEELIDGVEIGGVAMYLDKAEAGNVNLFVG